MLRKPSSMKECKLEVEYEKAAEGVKEVYMWSLRATSDMSTPMIQHVHNRKDQDQATYSEEHWFDSFYSLQLDTDAANAFYADSCMSWWACAFIWSDSIDATRVAMAGVTSLGTLIDIHAL